MCDDTTEAENAAHFSRRGFSLLGAGALAACASGQTVDGETLSVAEREVEIVTPDGVCDAHFVYPVRGKHPGVIVWPDIRGLRPAFRAMGKRLAESGYAVLVVNQFYRNQKAPVAAPGEKFSDPAVRARLLPMAQALSRETALKDAMAFVAFLDGQGAVDTSRRMGAAGYCMGGPLVLYTAAAVPARIGACASFHGGGLLTDRPTSPHLLIPQMTASFLIAVAQNDDARAPAEKDALKAAFAAANRPAEIEVYPARHGWCPPDSDVYDEAQAEKAWDRMLALFRSSLG